MSEKVTGSTARPVFKSYRVRTNGWVFFTVFEMVLFRALERVSRIIKGSRPAFAEAASRRQA